MTYPRSAAHRPSATSTDPLNSPNDLTDSAIHRGLLGTQVRLHIHGGRHVDCALLDIAKVATWVDLASYVERCAPLEVLSPRRYAFGPGVVLWAEVISDPLPGGQQAG